MCGDYFPEHEKIPTVQERIEKLEKSHEEILGLLTKMVDFLHECNEVKEQPRGVCNEKDHTFERNTCID